MNDILIAILEFLPAYEIYDIIRILYIDNFIEKYYEVISIIYFKLYNLLYERNLINNNDIRALVYNTHNVFFMRHSYIYEYQKNIQFSPEEISIRNIIFRKFNNIGIYGKDKDGEHEFLYNYSKIGCNCSCKCYVTNGEAHEVSDESSECECDFECTCNKITSLYYLLYDTGYKNLVSRFIGDQIVVSPFECTHSNIKRTTMHYYGGDQTLRMALRFQKHDMIYSILLHIQFLKSKKKIFSFIWNNNNVLYECLDLDDYLGITGFTIMLDFAKKHHNLKKILMTSDVDMSHSNDNSFSERDDHMGYSDGGGRYAIGGDTYGIYDDNIDRKYSSNLLIDALLKDLEIMFSRYFQINGYNWDWGVNEYITILDFNIHDFNINVNCGDIHFVISEKFKKYLDNQFDRLIEYCEENIESMKYIHTINLYLQDNINIFSSYIKKLSDGHTINYYLLIELFEIKFKNRNLFLTLYLILNKLNNPVKMDKDFLYPQNIYNGFNKKFTIIEYLKSIIYHDLYDEYSFLEGSTFVHLVNYLLCYRLINGSW